MAKVLPAWYKDGLDELADLEAERNLKLRKIKEKEDRLNAMQALGAAAATSTNF